MTSTAPNFPLVLTLTLEDDTKSYFNELRKQYFPPERNYLDAHLSLFHNLPSDEAEIVKDIKKTAQKTEKMLLQATEVVGIGNGVAFKIVCEALSVVHKELQGKWQKWLIPQDKQKLWPHITIQNKVLPDAAKALKQQLEHDFTSFSFIGTGLSLWEYHGGPWKFIEDFEFKR